MLSFLEKRRIQNTPPDGIPTETSDKTGRGRCGHAWKLFFAWVLVPPLLLCAVELGLRLGGLGFSTRLFLEQEVNGETVCVTNTAFFQQFYVEPFQMRPVEFSMLATKPPDTYRVFVFGSSAAHGGPVPDFSFWGILETMLRAGRHGDKIEIHCLALPGANSHVMRAAAKACAAFQPDLFLVYMGNNELNPWLTRTLVWDRLPLRPALFLFHLTIALNDSRLVQWLNGISGTDVLARLRADSVGFRQERAYQYYQANVNDICRFAKAAGAQVILCTVGSRLREWVPQGKCTDVLDTKAAQQWSDAYASGRTLTGQGRFREALAAYARAAEIDNSHAGLAYGIACCRYALGEYEDARNEFVRARELDISHYRAGNRINDILRDIAAARARDGVHLADTAQSLSDASPNGIVGPELFLDHVHPRFEGNYVLARSVLETLAQVEPRFHADSPPPTLEECLLRQAMTQPELRDQLLLTESWFLSSPDQPRDRFDQEMAELNEHIGARADDMRLEACRNALHIAPENDAVRTRYVRLLRDRKDTANALEHAKVLASHLPYSWSVHRLLAQLFTETGQGGPAIDALRRALALRPDDADAFMELGQLLHKENQSEQALAAFRASFTLRPGARAQCEIARVLRRQGDPSGAVDAYRRCLRLEPENPDAFEELILTLYDANRLAEANREMRHRREAMTKSRAGTATAVEATGQTETVSGRPAEDEILETRVSVLRQLVRLLPQNGSTFCRFQDLIANEAARLEAAGDQPGAVEAYKIAIPLNPDNTQPLLSLDKALSKNAPAERLVVWESAWKDNPGIPLAAVYCGAARAATGDVAGAKEAFDAAHSLAPDEWSHWVIAADALAAAGAPDDAISAYQRALALNPKLDYLHGRMDTVRKNAARGASPPQTVVSPSPSR